jgi:signal transduction histidine kinase
MKKENLLQLADALGIPAWISQSGMVLDCSAAAQSLTRVPEARLDAAIAQASSVAASDPLVQEFVARAEAGERATLDLRDPTSAIGSRLCALPSDDGATCVLLVHHVPNEIRESASAIGRASAEINHEVSNALGAILGWAQLGRARNDVPHLAHEAFAHIEESARTARDAAQRMLGHEPASEQPLSTNLSSLLERATQRLKPEAEHKQVTIDSQIQEDLHVLATPDALWTIVWNLAKNALEALESGGVLTLEAHGIDDVIELLVSDDGVGMDAETQKRIFEPYFTTKAEGTGLGLPIVKQTIEALGGTLAVSSHGGRGTVFTVRLPRSERLPRIAQPPARQTSIISRAPQSTIEGLRILVVDDEPAIRELVATALELRGAQVRTAAGAEELKRVAGVFDVAIVDLTLKDGQGDALVAELQRRGAIRASIIMSGLDRSPFSTEDAEPEIWIRKPFELDELIGHVAEIAGRLTEPIARRAP